MAHTDTVLGEVQRRLIDLDLTADARDAVMAMVRAGVGGGEGTAPRDGAQFRVLVARTVCRTMTRATDAVGSASSSMMVMLFDLFVANEQHRSVSVSSLCIASGAAPTTALRQIGQLEARGFVVRQGDEHDRRRCWVRLTPRGIALIRSMLEDWAVVLCG